MDYFIDKATHLQTQLAIWIEQLELPLSAFLEAGQNGLFDLEVDVITREKSTFADHIVDSKFALPKDVMKAMCLGVAYVECALEMYEKRQELALAYIFNAAEEVAFCRGVHFGVGHVYANRRVALSASGKRGALSLHSRKAKLKAWALSQAKGNRGSHIDIARELVKQIPEHLTGISKDPKRLIYDALRAQKNPN